MSKYVIVTSIILLILTACAEPTPTQLAPPTEEPTSEPVTQAVPSPTVEPTQQVLEPADIIFHNGNVITMEADQPSATAIAIRGESILAVGSDADVLAYANDETKVIDLDGLTIMPGFVDPHTHLLKDSGLGIDGGQQLALENGITTMTEMTARPEFLEELQAFDAEEKFRVRVTAYLGYTDPCGDAHSGDWYLAHPISREFGDMLHISGVKFFADGGVCGLPAVGFDYPGGQGQGDLWFTQDELNEIAANVHNNGYQIAIHAQGDRAIEQAQNAIAFALNDEPNTPRHRIEHNAFHREDLLPRYSEIGIVPTIFGIYYTCAELERGAYANFFGAENLSWLENWRMFVDANPDLIISWHGDDPWVVPISPLLELYSMVTRNEVAEDGSVCEAPDWLAAHSITVEEALPMMTINAAYALFREDEAGSLAPGKLADLLILSGNPYADPYAIKDIEVWMTMVGGKTEYCSAPDMSLCPGISTSILDSDSNPFGYLDSPAPDETVSGIYPIFGWALDDGGPIDRVEIYLDGEYIGNAIYGAPRPDVAEAYPGSEGASNSGFSFELDSTLYNNGPHTLSVVAYGSSGNQGVMIPETLTITIEN